MIIKIGASPFVNIGDPEKWFIYQERGDDFYYLLRDLKWHRSYDINNEEIMYDFYYATKEEAEVIILKWEATVP